MAGIYAVLVVFGCARAFSAPALQSLLPQVVPREHLAQALAAQSELRATVSLAGRTANPVLPPLPTRIGGFGGVAGLVRYLREQRITAVVDATHPFAAQMSAHAVAACRETGVPLLASLFHPDRWLLWLGLAFILCVYFFPTGIVGKLRQRR